MKYFSFITFTVLAVLTSSAQASISPEAREVLAANTGRVMGTPQSLLNNFGTCYIEVRDEVDRAGRRSAYVEYFAGFSSNPQVIRVDLLNGSGSWTVDSATNTLIWTAPKGSSKPNLALEFDAKSLEFTNATYAGATKQCKNFERN